MNEKLTAYALNELPPDERAAFETQMKSDPALQMQVEEMKTFCAMISREVADEEAALTSSQRVSVMRVFKNGPPAEKPAPAAWQRPAFFIPTTLAACVAIAVVVSVRETASPHGKRLSVETVQVTMEKVSHPSSMPMARKPEPAAPGDPLLAGAATTPAAPPAIPRGKDNMKADSSQGSKVVPTPSLAFNDPLGNAGDLRKTGNGTLTFDNMDAVPAVPKEGAVTAGGWATTTPPTVTVNGGASLTTDAPAAPVLAKDGGQLDVTGMIAQTGTVSGAVISSGTFNGTIVKSGAGALQLKEFNTYSGGTVVNPAGMTTDVTTTSGPVSETPAFRRMDVGNVIAAITPANPVPSAPAPPMPVLMPAPAAAGAATPTHSLGKSPAPAVALRTAAEAEKSQLELGDKHWGDDNLNGHRRDDESKKMERSNISGETYTPIYENPFLFVTQQPLSTFSIDVDTASYANVRRFLNEGQRPPADAVRLEELINYFPYTYEGPSDGKPFGVMVDVAETPWQPLHRLVRVALKGREVNQERGAANFVFLVDVSGSMDSPDKLPLVQRSLEMLTRQLGEKDRVALVVYAGSSGLVLPSTLGTERETILDAISNLKAGGSTNGASGIKLAYQEAAKHFVKGGVNRVILCTDGDFNVGMSTPEELEKLIAEKAKSRIFLSVLGFGTGNLKDRTMETLADKGNGNYAYLDSLSEARKALVEQMNGTLVTIAKDVKIQVEFNPTQVSAYRLLGYENRLLAKEDFNNDKKDAGEIGAGHTVTALYEVVPANVKFPDGKPVVDELKYAATAPKPITPADDSAAAAAPQNPAAASNNEMLTVKLRYKQPEGDKSDLLEVPVTDKEKKLADSPRDFQFAASVAGFGMLLRGSQHAGDLTWDMVRELALHGKGEDTQGYRGEFLQLIDKARGLTEAGPQ